MDFVLYGENVFIAIEVKRAAQVYETDLRGLKAFHEDYPEAKLALLYLGVESLRIANIPCLPLSVFLQKLDPRDMGSLVW